jgi:tetrahydromethanopterin S-methyltransferase subunit F
LRSQQCLKIELIDDSLAEFWEMFSVTISTNSSTVNLTRREFNVYIGPNDGECIEGNVTGSTNACLQLVEMCNSDGVWSPICDNEWTQEDATVVCRELGYQEPKSVRYETINKTMVNAIHNISCRGNETALRDCVSTEPPVNTVCQLALVDCSPDITVIVDPEVDTSDDPNDDDDVDRETDTEDTRNDNNVITRKNKSGTGSTGGIVSGVVVTLFLVLVLIAAVVVVIICFRWKTKQMAVNTKQVNINQNYESHDMLQDGEKHLDNPVYSFGNDQKAPQPQTDKDPVEHEFANPLYSLAEVEKPQCSTIDIYADDDPEYAVPERKDTGTQSSSELNNPEPAYAYAENV